MKHRAFVLGAALAFSVAMPATTTQADPAGECPSDKWSVSVFPLDWQRGDPMDPNGENLLLSLGNAAAEEVFGSLDEAAQAFGFANFEEFYAEAVDPDYNRLDQNDDGVLCFKPYPEQSSKAPYEFLAIDNRAHAG